MIYSDTNSWQGIQTEVMRRIASREWKPGDLIPGEAELAGEFGCARTTVNRALRELAETGLLERRRKRGTRVARHPVRKATVEIPIIRQDVEARGATYSFELLQVKDMTPSPALQSSYGLARGTPLRGLWSLHLADDAPFAFEERWVNLVVVPEILQADMQMVSANEWLVNHIPLSRGDFSFSASNASASEAKFLKCAEGAAVFTVNRTTWAGDEPITAVRLVYAPGYSMETVV